MTLSKPTDAVPHLHTATPQGLAGPANPSEIAAGPAKPETMFYVCGVPFGGKWRVAITCHDADTNVFTKHKGEARSFAVAMNKAMGAEGVLR